MTNPSPLFKLNGGSPGVKASVAAGATVTATLNDTSGVTFVEWDIATTDETTVPGDYTLSTNGGAVPGNETMTFTAGAAGTSGIIRATINHGVNATTGNAASETEPDVTISTAKWYVPTAVSALEVFADAEGTESDLTHGQTGELNQAIRALGGGGPGAFTYIELGSGTKATVGLIRTARNFIGWAYRNSLGSNSAIITEDNADGLAFGDQSQTVKIALDVKALGSIVLREAGSNVVAISGTAVNLTSGVSLQINGVGHTAAATASSLAFRGASGESAFAYLYASGSVPTTGFIRGQSGFVAVAALTAAGSFNNIGLADDGADGWKVGNDTRAAAVRLSVKTGGSATVEVNNVVEVTMDAAGINLASGNTYQVNGVAHATTATNSSLAFRGSSAELAVGYLYSAGTVSTTGFVRCPSSSTIVAFRDFADTMDVPALYTDGSDRILLGSGAASCGGVTLDANGGAGYHDLSIDASPLLRVGPGEVSAYSDVTVVGLKTAATGSTITSASTLDTTQSTVYVDAAGGSFSLALPAAATVAGRIWTIVKITAANTVTLDADGTEKINGALTYAITTQWSSITIQAVNKPLISEWIVIATA